MRYSRSVKVSVLKKILPPESRSIRSVSREMGISELTIRRWKLTSQSGRFKPETDEKSPRYYSSHEKYQLLLEAARVPEESLGQFLRERGLHTEHLSLWEQELREMMKNKDSKQKSEMQADKKRIRELEKELNRKEKALAEVAALLVLKKKLEDLTEAGGDA